MDDYNQNSTDDVLSLWPFAASAAAGLVIGLERRYAGAAVGAKGFLLIALFGTLIALVAEVSGSAVVIAAGLVVVGAAGAAASITSGSPARFDVMSIVIAVWCFALGAATWYGYTQAALLLAVASAVLLRLSAPRQAMALRWSADDVTATLQFVVLAIALLPFAPDEEYGPYGVLNPYHIWLVAVLATVLAWVGFALLRLQGSPGRVLVSGLAGGIVSPAAATASCARAVAQDAATTETAAATVGLASVGAVLRIGVVAAAAMPRFLSPIGAVVGATVLIALPVLIARGRKASPALVLSWGNPARLLPSFGVAAAYCVCLVALAWLVDQTGKAGMMVFTLAAGFAPGGAAGIAALRLGSIGDPGTRAAVIGFGCALLSMLGVQWLIALRLGGREFARRCRAGLVVAAAAICVGTAVALALAPADS